MSIKTLAGGFRLALGEDLVTLILVAVLVGALSWYILSRFIRLKGRLPPGPIGLPLVGIAPRLGAHPQITFTKWGLKYGRIYSFYLGPNLAILLNDYETIKETYIDQAETFSSRPDSFVFRSLRRGQRADAVKAEELKAREERRLMLRSFHELGVGKSRFENLCLEEADCLITALLQHPPDQPFNVRLEFEASVANVIYSLLFGRRLAWGDPVLRDFMGSQHIIVKLLGSAGPLHALPFLRFFPPWRSIWHQFQNVNLIAQSMIETEVNRIGKEYDPAHEPQNVIEHILQQRAQKFGSTESTPAAENDAVFSTINILSITQGLFGAGTETSISTLTWFVLMLVRYPKLQQKCFDEIASKVGRERKIGYDDRSNLPYVEAFLLEVWRRINLVPLSLQRRTIHDTYIDGYYVPAHTSVIPNMWQVHRDARHFPQPLEFRPERFLVIQQDDADNVEKTKIMRSITNMPFCVGRRACVGETVARMEIFVFVANMIQQIEFYLPPGKRVQDLPTEDDFTTGITVQPMPFEVCVRRRQQKN